MLFRLIDPVEITCRGSSAGPARSAAPDDFSTLSAVTGVDAVTELDIADLIAA